MRNLAMTVSGALMIGVAATPLPLSAADDSGRPAVRAPVVLAFSLDEMNCFSSDVQARAAVADPGPDAPRKAILLAEEHGGGSNGIPCPRRDPKSTPAQRAQG
jgi:hypothetical protein